MGGVDDLEGLDADGAGGPEDEDATHDLEV
jgi:hypothetical protein